jgi:hypothetical protein
MLASCWYECRRCNRLERDGGLPEIKSDRTVYPEAARGTERTSCAPVSNPCRGGMS